MNTSISPIDGRYEKKTRELAPYFSEHGLIYNRAKFELLYLIALQEHGKKTDALSIAPLSQEDTIRIRHFMETTINSDEFIAEVKEIEKTTNHDVKAVEYALRSLLQKNDFPASFIEHCHFGLTSEDVNNCAIAFGLEDSMRNVFIPVIEDLINDLYTLAVEHADTPMLARTHGQPATPTTFGKEMMIPAQRLKRQLRQLENYQIRVKINGPSGNYNGHVAAYPGVDWPQFMQEFIDSMYEPKNFTGAKAFQVNQWTTQIEDHDTYSELFAIFQRISSILKKLCKDIWLYISQGLIVQKRKDSEVGSSAMPHKVNPIDFENAEGNLKMAYGLFEIFCRELPDTRLQRDLSDSTVERNFGTAFSHMLIACQSIEKGLGKISVNVPKMTEEVDAHPEILAEAYQLVLKKHGKENAYEEMKKLTRGEHIELKDFHAFLDTVQLPEQEKIFLRDLTPSKYLGIAPRLATGFDMVDMNYSLRDNR